MARTSRDHARTPMQWSAAPNGGFTSAAKAWLAVNPNYPEINAEAALADPGSVYHHYARLAELRRTHSALVYGDFGDLAPEHPHLFAYNADTRRRDPDRPAQLLAQGDRCRASGRH